MKTTQVFARLSNYLKFFNVPGNILNGKHRIWPKLTTQHKRNLLKQIDQEINNMKLTSIPFIEEDKTKIFNKFSRDQQKIDEDLKKKELIRANKRKINDKLMSEHLDCLRSHRVWE